MNDNTIIRIKVPAHLYESVKAKLMVKEDASPLQKLEEAKAKIEKMISEAKKADPKKAAEDKKKADEKKKKEAEAKKVADKKAADKKKADEKKK
jgi:hypothetical protein